MGGATVSFLGDAKLPTAVGVTDDSGNFSLVTMSRAGAVPGQYTVTVSKRAPVPAAAATKNSSMEGAAKAAQLPKATAVIPPSLIPEKYESAGTSALSFTVKAGGTNDFKIELKD